MKRILALLLCAAMLAGCSMPARSTAGASSQAQSTPDAADSAAAGEPAGVSAAAGAQTPVDDDLSPLTGLPREGEAMRPVAVMVNNSAAVTVQWGVADAELVMEGLTEGKSTNLCLWYSSVDVMPKTGPVTEGKDLFWQFGIAENAVLSQKGMNRYAKNLLNCYAYQPIDALYVGVNSYDYARDLPAGTADADRWYTRGASLVNSMNSYGIAAAGTAAPLLRFGTAAGGTGGAAAVTVAYSAESSAALYYDAASGLWQVFRTGGAPLADAETGAQVAVTNVLLLRCTVGVKDDRYTRDYDLTGGTGWYVTGDTWQPVTWRKGDVTEPLQLYAADGSELTVSAGRSYVGFYGITGQSVAIADAAGTLLAGETVEPAAPAQG